MEVLNCIGVRKIYGKGSSQTAALNGIDLSVEKGEFTAIVGASGSGKSTLLHILGSVDHRREGHCGGNGYLFHESHAGRHFPAEKSGAGLSVL